MMKKQSQKLRSALLAAATLMVSAALSACGPSFVAFSDPTDAETGAAGAPEEPTPSPSAGAPASQAGAGGGTSSAGAPSVGGAAPHCLQDFEVSECAAPCTGSAYLGCVTILQCMREKNVKPAQSPVDPCYGTGYEELTIATRAYQACCN